MDLQWISGKSRNKRLLFRDYFYSEGGRPNPNIDPEMRPRSFKPEEKRALLAFLRTLTGRIREGW